MIRIISTFSSVFCAAGADFSGCGGAGGALEVSVVTGVAVVPPSDEFVGVGCVCVGVLMYGTSSSSSSPKIPPSTPESGCAACVELLK